jgi:hypothetical protein
MLYCLVFVVVLLNFSYLDLQYEFLKRSSKRKRDDEELSGSDDEPGNKKR